MSRVQGSIEGQVAGGDCGAWPSGPIRLQRYLARAGAASRRGSEDLMTAGRVKVNGVVVRELGSKVDPRVDIVSVDDRVVAPTGTPVYLALNKPCGVITTMNDPRGRDTVADVLNLSVPGIFPVGRLDRDTSGLLLFTTDGALAYRLLHPRFHVEKEYVAHVKGAPSRESIGLLAQGLVLEDGLTLPARVELLERATEGSRVRITIREGRKRQVRRMFDAIGHPVLSLHRTAFGPVRLTDEPVGSHRPLTPGEVAALARITEGPVSSVERP